MFPIEKGLLPYDSKPGKLSPLCFDPEQAQECGREQQQNAVNSGHEAITRFRNMSLVSVMTTFPLEFTSSITSFHLVVRL